MHTDNIPSLLATIANLSADLDNREAEKAAALAALAAALAYGREQHARALRAEGEVQALRTMAQRAVYTPTTVELGS